MKKGAPPQSTAKRWKKRKKKRERVLSFLFSPFLLLDQECSVTVIVGSLLPGYAFDDQIRHDLRPVRTRTLRWRRLLQQPSQGMTPPPCQKRFQIDELAAQERRHLFDHDVVFDKAAARGVEHRGFVRDAVRDDPVTGLGEDDVHRGDEVDIAEPAPVDVFFGDAVYRAINRIDLGRRRRMTTSTSARQSSSLSRSPETP